MNKLIFILILIVAIVGGIIWLTTDTPTITVEKTKIDRTPTQIKEIKSIAEWEFLSVECEVLVDSVRKRSFFMTDDRLVRIYRGSLRLGVNLKEADENWIKVEDSVVYVNLPQIKLLDDRFIDEAGSVSFFESGKWDGKSKEDLVSRAEKKMRKYALTPVMFQRAKEQAEIRFTSLFSALGFKNVKVSFAEEQLKK